MHYSFKSTPTTTFKSRTQNVTKSNQPSSIPGPGNYNVVKPLPRSASLAQTHQKRVLFKTNDQSPGPGAYQTISYLTSGTKRSMSAKFITPPIMTPGPLEYQSQVLKTKHKAPMFSMGRRSKSHLKIIEQHNMYKPEPTKYEARSTFNSSAGVIFGSSKRRDLTETEKTPAPNKYTQSRNDLITTANPRCSIGGQKRELKIAVFENTPGPGTYNKKTFMQQNKFQKKGYTCRQKVRNLVAEQLSRNPAPGHYNSQILTFKNTAPRCSTTQTKRKTFIDQAQQAKKNIPTFSKSEVNFFNSSKFRSSSASIFGRSQRRSLDQNQSTPGPVGYDSNKIKVLNKYPSFSCSKSQARNQFLKAINPEHAGPALYDAKIQAIKNGRGSIIVMRQNRPNFDKQKQKPGPGYYNLTKKQDARFGFTLQKRIAFTDSKNQAKDGVHYNLNTNISNPPSYMQVQSKIKFSPSKSLLRSTGTL